MESLFQKFYVFCNSKFEKLIDRLTPNWVTPNAISFLRIFLALPILTLLFFGQKGPAIGVFVLAALTDYWDGALARARNQVTEFGKYLDPMCDKGFLALLLLPLTFLMFFHGSEARIDLACLLAISLINIGLETCLAAIRTDNYLHRNDFFAETRDLGATMSGKIKFILQVLGAGMAIVANPNLYRVCILVSAAFLAAALPFLIRSIQQKTKRM